MKPNEPQRKSFFDIVLENSKMRDDKKNQPTSSQTRGLTFWIGWAIGFLLLGLVIHLAVAVCSTKLGWPSFSYIEILKLYAAAIVIRKLFK